MSEVRRYKEFNEEAEKKLAKYYVSKVIKEWKRESKRVKQFKEGVHTKVTRKVMSYLKSWTRKRSQKNYTVNTHRSKKLSFILKVIIEFSMFLRNALENL